MTKGSTELTATANWEIKEELEFGIAKVLGEHVVDEVIRDRYAYRQFREFVQSQEGGSANANLLDFYQDIRMFSEMSAQLRTACTAISDIYLVKSSPHRLQIPITLRGPILETLRSSSTVGLGMLEPQKELLGRLYEKEFQEYMLKRLVDHAVVRLGNTRVELGDSVLQYQGLGDCYVLTNPRLRDHPIVLASEGFAQLTGYPLETIIGRNCRFLQGPGTSPDSVARLRKALNNSEVITSLLLNYRKGGEPFFNLLCMLPLKDNHGNTKYFLGGQVDVTGSLRSLLHSPQSSTDDQASSTRHNHPSRFSTAVQLRAEQIMHDTQAQSPHLGLSRPFQQINKKMNGSSSGLASGTESSTAGVFGAVAAGLKRNVSSGKKAFKGQELGLTAEEHEHSRSYNEAPDPLLDKLEVFQATYSRVILLRCPSREILFVTPELVAFCDLTPAHGEDLISTDFTKLLTGCTNETTSRIRRNVKAAIDQGHSYAVAVYLSPRIKGAFGMRKPDDGSGKSCVLHLTPLSGKDGTVEAFVAVFGTGY